LWIEPSADDAVAAATEMAAPVPYVVLVAAQEPEDAAIAIPAQRKLR